MLQIERQGEELAPVGAADEQQGQQHQQGGHGPLAGEGPAHQAEQQQGDGRCAHPGKGGEGAAGTALGLEQGLVGLAGDALELGIGLAAHRLVAADPVALVDGGHIGIDPVVAAILAAVLHHATPGLALLEAGPEIGEGRLGHVWVAHQIVVVADQLVDRVAGDAAEGGVGVGDHPAQIRGGDQLFVGRKLHFAVQGMDVSAGHRNTLRCSC